MFSTPPDFENPTDQGADNTYDVVIQAIDSGFAKALATIVDTNVTTLIAAAVLFWLGSEPVKGFAVTFAIGIVTTVFTAFTLTRWLMAEWVKRWRPTELPWAPVTLVPPGTTIPFMGIRRWTFALSIALSIASVVVFVSFDTALTEEEKT